jgi:hypothetical protein
VYLHDGDPFGAAISVRCEKARFFSLIRLHAATAKTGKNLMEWI